VCQAGALPILARGASGIRTTAMINPAGKPQTRSTWCAAPRPTPLIQSGLTDTLNPMLRP